MMTEAWLYGLHDFVLQRSPSPGEAPFGIAVSATFVHEEGERIEDVPGFCDGDGRYVIRFSPDRLGTWTGTTASDDPRLDGQDLPQLRCTGTAHPLRGMPRIDPANGRRFVWDDGAPYVPLGFVCDWLFAYHQRHPEECARQFDGSGR
jgi:hypothetical protein